MQKTVVFLLLFLAVKIASAQVSSLPVELPQEVKRKYPFLGDKIYNVEYNDGENGTGMFVLTIDKKTFQQYIQKKAGDTVKYYLRRYDFYKQSCRYNGLGVCSPDYTDIIQHKLTTYKPAFQLANNRNLLAMDFRYDLNATIKKVDRYFQTYECKKDTDYDRNKLLSKIEFNIDQSYTFDPRTAAIRVQFDGEAQVDIRYAGCSIFYNRAYTSRKLVTQNFNFGLNLDFSSAGAVIYDLIKSMTLNTKKIKITEDETYYYVYCIRQA